MLANEEEYLRRLTICRQCEHVTGTKIPVCELCGCLLKMKARLIDFGCPIGKWSSGEQIGRPNLIIMQQIAGGCKSCGK